jgi:maleylpyruvate isomerase
LTESMAICEYFEEVYPDRRSLMPKDAIGKFHVRRLCETINAGTQPIQNSGILNEIGARFGD